MCSLIKFLTELQEYYALIFLIVLHDNDQTLINRNKNKNACVPEKRIFVYFEHFGKVALLNNTQTIARTK